MDQMIRLARIFAGLIVAKRRLGIAWGERNASNTSVWRSPRFSPKHTTAERNASMTIAVMPRPNQLRCFSVSVCRRLIGESLARPTSYEIHLPGAYLTFVELMSKRPRLLHVVATRLSDRATSYLHRIDEAKHLPRLLFSEVSVTFKRYGA